MSNSPVSNLDEQVASEIRALMGRQRLSARGLARKIGTNDVWVSRRLRGSVGITFGDLSVRTTQKYTAVADADFRAAVTSITW